MKNHQNYIKKTTNYTYNISNNQDTIHIGYGIDNNYARCCATSIISFCMNNNNQSFEFHIMTNDLSNNAKKKFELLAQNLKTNILIYEVDNYPLNTLPTQIHLPISTYFRFLLPLVLKNIPTLYYIDADIICLKDTNELFNINLGNNIIAAVPDLPIMNAKRNKALNLVEHLYFNAGMLVINIQKWLEFDTFNKVLNAIKQDPQKFRYLDQDALNIVLHGKILYLSSKFNNLTLNYEDTVLLHFAAHPKPWNIAFPISKICNTFNKNLYQYYENKTPWKSLPLEQPKNYKEMKIYSYALYHNQNYLSSLKWYLKYIFNKI